MSNIVKLHGTLAVVLGIAICGALVSSVYAGTPVQTAVLTKSQDTGTTTRTADYRPAENQATVMPVQWGWSGGYSRPYYRYTYYRAPYSYGYYTGPYSYGYYPYYSGYYPTYYSPSPYYTYSYPYPYTYYYGPRSYAYYGGYYGW